MTESRGVLVRVRTLSFPLKTAACRGAAVDFFSGQCAVGRSLPVASASPGLLLPLLDFFCLSGLLLPLCVAGRCPQEDAGLLVVVGPSLLLLPALLGAAGKTKTNSVLPPVSLLGDQGTHAPANACVCGLLHRPPSSSLLSYPPALEAEQDKRRHAPSLPPPNASPAQRAGAEPPSRAGRAVGSRSGPSHCRYSSASGVSLQGLPIRMSRSQAPPVQPCAPFGPLPCSWWRWPSSPVNFSCLGGRWRGDPVHQKRLDERRPQVERPTDRAVSSALGPVL